MPKMIETEQRTIETRLNCSQFYALLEELLAFYASLRAKLWRDLVIKSMPINELKSNYIKSFGVTARQFNSLAKQVSAQAKALEQLHLENKKATLTRIKVQERNILKLLQKIKGIKASLKAIATYRVKIATWKAIDSGSKRPKKKPSMPISIRGKHSHSLLKEWGACEAMLHQKNRRLQTLKDRLRARESAMKPSLCFGSKSLFKAQFYLAENGYGTHSEWLQDFRLARSTQMYFVGSSDETLANQTVQYDPLKKTLTLRLPNTERFLRYGKSITIEQLEFPAFLLEDFRQALAKPSEPRNKTQRSNLPVTYRFVRRVNKNTGVRAYYLQASFAFKGEEISSLAGNGVVGVDLNADHLAVAETDRFGNWIDSYILPFKLDGLSSHQTKAIIGDLVAVVIEKAKAKGKALALEELDFTQKKACLKLLPKDRRKYLSQFAYSHFIRAMQSRAHREGVRLVPINPAYTSLIGVYKYQGLNVSSHEKAALCIARRAQGFTEGLNVFQGTLPSQVMMAEKSSFREQSTRHVWGFYGDNQRKIRELFIEDKRSPLLPLKRAISLTQRKSSLQRSLVVTREKRIFDELSCLSG